MFELYIYKAVLLEVYQIKWWSDIKCKTKKQKNKSKVKLRQKNE